MFASVALQDQAFRRDGAIVEGIALPHPDPTPPKARERRPTPYAATLPDGRAVIVQAYRPGCCAPGERQALRIDPAPPHRAAMADAPDGDAPLLGILCLVPMALGALLFGLGRRYPRKAAA